MAELAAVVWRRLDAACFCGSLAGDSCRGRIRARHSTFSNSNIRASWVSGNQAATAPIEADLGNFELHAVSALHEPNPTVNVAFKKNLEIVDNYIAECEKSVQDDPEDELSRDYLYGAYQQKADLLEQMSERGENHQ